MAVMEKNNVGNLFPLRKIYSRGITGKGITAAVLDTGIYPHRDFYLPEKRILYFEDFVKKGNRMYDDNGHGTHVCGIIASGGSYYDKTAMGMAPEASLVVLKVLEKDGRGRVGTMLRGIEWILEHYQEYGIRIVNISVGMPVKNTENPEEDILVKKVEDLWNHGMVVVVAAGNGGPEPCSVTSPGISRKVITVGAAYTGNDRREDISYSGRGPVPGTCVCKPDILAPAGNIVSCDNHGNCYKKRSGTSMATPIVTGAIALLLSDQPWLSNRDVKIRLMESAIDCGKPKSVQGWGLLNPEGLIR